MQPRLDSNECLKDSPLFRKKLSQAESEIDAFEAAYKRIAENCVAFYNDGMKYVESYK